MTKANQQTQSDADPNAISVEAALQRIQALIAELKTAEWVPRDQALQRVTAQNIQATQNVPPFRSSAMDGYAIRHSEASEALTVTAKSLAGHPCEDTLPKTACARITTGARVPDDADTVVQQENCTLETGLLHIDVIPTLSMHVRDIGSDIAKGALLIENNSRLLASELALLAAHKIDRVQVLRKLKIAVFSTGDELADPGAELTAGCIIDSNRPLLLSLLKDPAFELIDLGIIKDDTDNISDAFMAAKNADIIISTGGVSVGDADYVKTVLEKLGDLHLWKIAMKPGRPLTFGLLNSGQAFFGLPGNPVSSAVTTLLFVLPALRFKLGLPANPLPRFAATFQGEAKKLKGRVEFQRARLFQDSEGNWLVSNTGLQDSHRLTSFQHANCFIELAVESDGASNGDIVQTLPFALFGSRLI